MTAPDPGAALLWRLLRLPRGERLQTIRSLTLAQQRELNERWSLWAHPAQRVPEGDWRVWLIRAGRGFGKTRAGAEWVSAVARATPDARIALVGGTADEVRRVMIEGESGLIAVARYHERVTWRATTGEVTFPSGARAHVYSAEAPEGRVAELYALRPERVSVEPDAAGWPAAYRYAVGANVVRLDAGPERPQLIHLRSFNPLDDHYGLGCLGAAAAGIAVHNAAARWNVALLDTAARPSGALVYDPGDGSALSPEQFARLKAEMEAGFAGAANAGRPMLLEGGLKWQALSLSPADMDFAGTKAAAARDIALAFGVPPMLLGLPGDSTYANYREANRALWRLTVLPLAGTILAGLAHGLRGWFSGAALSVDLDRVPVLAEDRQALWAMVGAAGFLSDAEKRERLGVA